jgi:hypothetical protein
MWEGEGNIFMFSVGGEGRQVACVVASSWRGVGEGVLEYVIDIWWNGKEETQGQKNTECRK